MKLVRHSFGSNPLPLRPAPVARDGSAADTAGHINKLRLAEPADRRGPGTPG